MEDRMMRIGIIGGGISGVTAAYYLQNKGYRQVTLLEKSERVGGKCHTIVYRGRTYEMGTIMGLPSYATVNGLMKKFRITARGPQLSRGYFDAEGRRIQQLPREQLYLFARQLKQLPDILQQADCLKKPGFSGIPEELTQPFSDWCDKHGLSVLKKVYAHCFTTFGFGSIEQVPAAYVLKVITYENLMAFIEITYITTWTEGISELVARIADRLDDVRLTQEAVRLEPQSKGTLRVKTANSEFEFDRVIYAAPPEGLPALLQLPADVLELWKGIRTERFRVYAYRAKNIPELCGYIPQNLAEERRGHITIWYYRWADRESTDLVTAYAYGKEGMEEAEARALVEEDLRKFGCEDLKLYMCSTWNHFAHVDSQTLRAGFYTRLEALQKELNLYFCGELMSAPTLENCTAYSKYLVDTYF